MQFFKMEGAGNDYIYMDLRRGHLKPAMIDPGILPGLCDRRYGVGADGLVLIAPSAKADARMWMWNADGSSSAMCGNALRCVALYVSLDEGRREVVIETGAGLHRAEILFRGLGVSGSVRVDMGAPVFESTRIPFKETAPSTEAIPRFQLEASDLIFSGDRSACVLSMGNPHCVFFVDDPDALDLAQIGPQVENDSHFPERTNVEFVSIRGDGTLYQRTWERGSGETLACGSGACAVLVASVLTGRGPRKNTVHLRGGDLEVEWTDSNVWMTGPARLVFRGELEPEIFKLFKA